MTWSQIHCSVRPATLLKKTLTRVFSCEFCKISKNTPFTKHLWTTAFAKCSIYRVTNLVINEKENMALDINIMTPLKDIYNIGIFLLLFSISRSCFMWASSMLKVNNRNTKRKCEICSKSTMTTKEWCQWHSFWFLYC